MSAARTDKPVVYQPIAIPERREIGVEEPVEWLKQGWQYFSRMRAVSLLYGSIFAAIGMLITWLGLSNPQFILTYWSGFLLIGPLLAVGLFRLAQQADRSDAVRLLACFKVIRENLKTVSLFVLLMSVLMIAWIRFSTLAVALYVGNVTGTADFLAALTTPEGLGFLAVLFGVGAVFALVVFALGAWSLPMVMDQRAEFGPALAISVKTVMEQPIPMLTWAAIVAGLTLVGMLTFFAGFAVIFPWLGYATWAGYKMLFHQDEH